MHSCRMKLHHRWAIYFDFFIHVFTPTALVVVAIKILLATRMFVFLDLHTGEYAVWSSCRFINGEILLLLRPLATVTCSLPQADWTRRLCHLPFLLSMVMKPQHAYPITFLISLQNLGWRYSFKFDQCFFPHWHNMDLQGLVTRWCNLLEVFDTLLFNQLDASNWWGSLCQIWKVRKLGHLSCWPAKDVMEMRCESMKTQNMEVKLWNESNIKVTSPNDVDMLMVDGHHMDLQYNTYELCVPFRFRSWNLVDNEYRLYYLMDYVAVCGHYGHLQEVTCVSL